MITKKKKKKRKKDQLFDKKKKSPTLERTSARRAGTARRGSSTRTPAPAPRVGTAEEGGDIMEAPKRSEKMFFDHKTENLRFETNSLISTGRLSPLSLYKQLFYAIIFRFFLMLYS